MVLEKSGCFYHEGGILRSSKVVFSPPVIKEICLANMDANEDIGSGFYSINEVLNSAGAMWDKLEKGASFFDMVPILKAIDGTPSAAEEDVLGVMIQRQKVWGVEVIIIMDRKVYESGAG